MLVDDHPVVREGLRGMLAAVEDIAVVGEAATADEAVAAAAKHAPDVVLMDLRMPGGDGAGATRGILRDRPACAVVVLTTYDTDSDILPAVEAGASGYLLKDTPPARLTDAIRAAAQGETVLAPEVATRLLANTRGADTSRDHPEAQLTSREREVLRLAAQGCGNGEIGHRLHIGATTVKTHLLRSYEKLGVSDRTAAVAHAIRRGMITPPTGDGPDGSL
ncbi:response regulator [Haloactinospora alba]|nr:response regulator transcription factor [Haloactinospora alba]